MADDKKHKHDEETALAVTTHETQASARVMLEVFAALQDVAKAELAKGPGIASNAWRKLLDVIGEEFGDEPLAHATPVVGRQPAFMPRFKNPPAKGGATPTQPGQGTHPPVETAADIRKRADVAAELERVKRGGK